MDPNKSEKTSPSHEITVWRARPFVIGLACFFAFMGLIFVIVGGLTTSWTHHTWPPSGPVENPSSTTGWNTAPPQLQVNAPLDLQHVRQLEDQHLHTTRWTDDSHAYAVIPIEQAMALLAQAADRHQLDKVLPTPLPMTPIQLQNQKSGDASPPPKVP